MFVYNISASWKFDTTQNFCHYSFWAKFDFPAKDTYIHIERNPELMCHNTHLTHARPRSFILFLFSLCVCVCMCEAKSWCALNELVGFCFLLFTTNILLTSAKYNTKSFHLLELCLCSIRFDSFLFAVFEILVLCAPCICSMLFVAYSLHCIWRILLLFCLRFVLYCR